MNKQRRTVANKLLQLEDQRQAVAVQQFKQRFNERFDGAYWLANGFSSADPDPLVKFAHLYRTTGYTLNQYEELLGVDIAVMRSLLNGLPPAYRAQHLRHEPERIYRRIYTGKSRRFN